MKKNLSQFIQASCVFLLINAAVVGKNYAQDRVNNGGTLNESARISERVRLEETANKIIHFFEMTPELAAVFPEFEASRLIALKNHVMFDVVEEELSDREGTVRTCLNSHIGSDYQVRCQLSKLRQWQNPQDIFVLVMHELLGLLDVEVSSVLNTDLRQSYPISSRLYSYVVQTANYDLRYVETRSTSFQEYEFHPIRSSYIDSIRLKDTNFSVGDSEYATILVSGSGVYDVNYNRSVPHTGPVGYIGFARKIGDRRLSTRRSAIEAANAEGIARCERETGANCEVLNMVSHCERRGTNRSRHYGVLIGGKICHEEDEFGIDREHRGPSRCWRERSREERRAKREGRRASRDKICGAYSVVGVRN